LFLFQFAKQREKRIIFLQAFIGLLSNADQLKKDDCISIVQNLIDNFNIDIKDEVRFFFAVDHHFLFLLVGT
jgi:hypothetical protein